MAVPQGNFPILNFEQNNPLITGLQKGLGIVYGARGSENELRTNAFKRALLEKYGVQEAEQGIEKDRLANELSKINLQYAPEQAQAEIGYKNAQVPLMGEQTKSLEFKRNNPLIGNAGAAGYIGALEFLEKQGDPHAAELKNAFMQENNRKNALTERLQTLTKAGDFDHAPVGVKEYQIGMGRTMGYTTDATIHALRQGKSLEDLAREKGYTQEDLAKMQPSMLATKPTLNRLQLGKTALAGINSVEPKILEALAPYSRKVMGVSPKLAWEGLTGINEHSQAKALAARNITPELQALRVKAQGGTVGITAIQDMQERALQNMRVFEAEVSPSVYKMMGEYTRQWINEMNQAENNSIWEIQNPVRSQRSHNYNQEDIAHTAELHGMSEEEVLNKLLGEENAY